MGDIFKCLCQTGDQHYWIKSFFNQVILLLKRLIANPITYDENHIQFFDDLAKIAVWKEIAHDYKGLFAKSE